MVTKLELAELLVEFLNVIYHLTFTSRITIFPMVIVFVAFVQRRGPS